MDWEKAISILEIDKIIDEESVLNAYEAKCFEIKDYFLRNNVIAYLFKNRIKRLISYEKAYDTLYPDNQIKPGIHVDHAIYIKDQDQLLIELKKPDRRTSVRKLGLNRNTTLIELLRSYEQSLSHTKLLLSQGENAITIACFAKELVLIQMAYEHLFRLSFSFAFNRFITMDDQFYDQEIKIANQINTAEIIKSFKQLKILEIKLTNPEEVYLILEKHMEPAKKNMLVNIFTEFYRIEKADNLDI